MCPHHLEDRYIGNSLSAMTLLARREAAERRVATWNFILIDIVPVFVSMSRWEEMEVMMVLLLFLASSFETMLPFLYILNSPSPARTLVTQSSPMSLSIHRLSFSVPKWLLSGITTDATQVCQAIPHLYSAPYITPQ